MLSTITPPRIRPFLVSLLAAVFVLALSVAEASSPPVVEVDEPVTKAVPPPVMEVDERGRFSTPSAIYKNFYLAVEGLSTFLLTDVSEDGRYDVFRNTDADPRTRDNQCAGCILTRPDSDADWGARLSLGYGKYVKNDRFYLGAELAASKLGHDATRNSGSSRRSSDLSLEHDFAYQFVLRPGIRVNDDATAFLRLGVERGRFEWQYAKTSTVKGTLHSASHKKSYWENAWVVGFDKEVQTGTEQIAFRLGWEYADYGDVAKSVGHPVVPKKGAEVNAKTKYQPTAKREVKIATFRTGFVWRPGAATPKSSNSYHDFGGFYGGLKGGYSGITEGHTESSSGRSIKDNYGEHSPSAGVSLGWGRQFNRLYAGVDLNYLAASGNIKRISQESSITKERDEIMLRFHRQAKNKYEADAALRLGYVLAPESLVYTKIGYATGKWKHIGYRETWNAKDGVPTDLREPRNQTSKTKRLRGLKAGIGIDTVIKDNWMLRSEWTYTKYGSEKISDDGKTEVEPKRHAFSLGILYGF